MQRPRWRMCRVEHDNKANRYQCWVGWPDVDGTSRRTTLSQQVQALVVRRIPICNEFRILVDELVEVFPRHHRHTRCMTVRRQRARVTTSRYHRRISRIDNGRCTEGRKVKRFRDGIVRRLLSKQSRQPELALALPGLVEGRCLETLCVLGSSRPLNRHTRRAELAVLFLSQERRDVELATSKRAPDGHRLCLRFRPDPAERLSSRLLRAERRLRGLELAVYRPRVVREHCLRSAFRHGMAGELNHMFTRKWWQTLVASQGSGHWTSRWRSRQRRGGWASCT